MSLREYFLGSDDEDLSESKTETETRTITNYFKVTRATVAYPDGSDETIEYTDATFGDDVTKVSNHTEKDYTACRNIGWGRHERTNIQLRIDPVEPRRFSMANVRDIEPQSIDQKVAVAEVEAEVDYERDSPDDEWDQVNIRLCDGSHTPDVTIWFRDEWKAHRED